ncbi:hypothetical protein TELCIR_10210, partial [Teladorsagia circumcincta]
MHLASNPVIVITCGESTTQAKVNSKMSAGSGTSGYSDVVVDAEDEKLFGTDEIRFVRRSVGTTYHPRHRLPAVKSGSFAVTVHASFCGKEYTAPLGSMSAEEKTCSTMPSEATDTKVTQWHGSSDAALEDEPFYHGYMARAEAEKVITKDGEFLVRKAEVRGRE